MAKKTNANAEAKPYIATSTIDHDGTRYLSGDEILLVDAARLLELGVVQEKAQPAAETTETDPVDPAA